MLAMAHICARLIALGFLWGSDSLFTRRSIVRRPALGTLFASTVNNIHWLDFIVMPLLSCLLSWRGHRHIVSRYQPDGRRNQVTSQYKSALASSESETSSTVVRLVTVSIHGHGNACARTFTYRIAIARVRPRNPLTTITIP